MANSNLALFCKLYPGSLDKQRRVVDLLRGLVPFYQTPEAKCTTWCYFTPSQRVGALNPISTDKNAPDWRSNPIVVGLEVYTDKSSLSTQLADPVYFQPYQEIANAEELYNKPEELMGWYPACGFLSRSLEPVYHEPGMVVITAEAVCKEGSRDLVLSEMERLVSWVAANEPDTLSYSIMTRPKAPNEVFVFERYRNTTAMLRHLDSIKIQELFSTVKSRLASVQVGEWEEVENSFVADLPTAETSLKFTTKL